MIDIIAWFKQNDWIKGISFALFGGFVRMMVSNDSGKFRIKAVLQGMTAALFVGTLVLEGIKYYSLNKNMTGLVSALSGFCHREMLDLMQVKFLAKIKRLKDDNKF